MAATAAGPAAPHMQTLKKRLRKKPAPPRRLPHQQAQLYGPYCKLRVIGERYGPASGSPLTADASHDEPSAPEPEETAARISSVWPSVLR